MLLFWYALSNRHAEQMSRASQVYRESRSAWPDEIPSGGSSELRKRVRERSSGMLSRGRKTSSAYRRLSRTNSPSGHPSDARKRSRRRSGFRLFESPGDPAQDEGQRDSDSGSGSGSAGGGASPEEQEDKWEVVGTPLDHRISTSMDSVPPHDAKCFACRYASTISDADGIRHEGVAKVIMFMHRNLYKMDMVELAKMTSELFDREVREPANRNLSAGKAPLRKFHWVTIIEHLRFHTDDSELNHLKDCRELRELCDMILKYKVYKRNKEELMPDGAAKWDIDPIALTQYLKTKRLALQFQKSSPKNMAWYQAGEQMQTGGSHVDAYFDRSGVNAYRAFPTTSLVSND